MTSSGAGTCVACRIVRDRIATLSDRPESGLVGPIFHVADVGQRHLVAHASNAGTIQIFDHDGTYLGPIGGDADGDRGFEFVREILPLQEGGVIFDTFGRRLTLA